MPIYAYKCESCGLAKDVLQKISDPVLTQCPACGAATFKKQVTAAGFQLKGSGWYATDFKGAGSASAAAPATTGAEAKTETKSDAKPSEPAASPPSGGGAPSASAGGCGSGCACH